MKLESNPSLRHWFSGRRACVIGLGKSGAAAAALLKRLGAEVSVTEKGARSRVSSWINHLPRGVRLETGSHGLLKKEWDLIVPSPGVPSTLWNPFAERGVSVWGEMELGYRVLSLAGRWPARTAAITGTNGKTTTTALIGAIFRAAGFQTVVAGNIGTPLCAAADRIGPGTALALEVSSYQLEAADAFRAGAGSVLNVTPDHLARHGTMESYARAKFRLFQNLPSGGAALLNAADPWDRRLAASVPGNVFWFGLAPRREPGIYRSGSRLVSRLPGAGGSWALPRHLPGDHNIENALAAAGCARLLGASVAAVGKALTSFPGVEHRLEFVRELRGVRYVNDSKATNVDSTLVALKAFAGGLHVVMGGEDKGAPYTPLARLLKDRAKAVYLIGEAAPKIRKDLRGVSFVECGDLARAVEKASARALPGETMLLSPACASFDQFDNFEHRGRAFKALVKAL